MKWQYQHIMRQLQERVMVPGRIIGLKKAEIETRMLKNPKSIPV